MISEQVISNSTKIALLSMTYALSQLAIGIYIVLYTDTIEVKILYCFVAAFWGRAVLIFIRILKELAYILEHNLIPNRGYTGFKLFLALLVIDENQIGNWLTVVMCAIYMIIELWLDLNDTNVNIVFYNIVQAITITITALVCKFIHNYQLQMYRIIPIKESHHKCRMFISLVLIYQIPRIAYYAYFLTLEHAINYSVGGLGGLTILAVLYIHWMMLSDLKVMDLQHVAPLNRKCFNGWFCLYKSLLFQQKFNCQINILLVLFAFQIIATEITDDGLIFQLILDESALYYQIECGLLFFWFIEQTIVYCIWRIIANYGVIELHIVYKKELDQYSIVQNANHYSNQTEEQIMECLKQSESQDCCICLQPMEHDLANLACHILHIFHKDCIEEWLQIHNYCPLCRKTI